MGWTLPQDRARAHGDGGPDVEGCGYGDVT